MCVYGMGVWIRIQARRKHSNMITSSFACPYVPYRTLFDLRPPCTSNVSCAYRARLVAFHQHRSQERPPSKPHGRTKQQRKKTIQRSMIQRRITTTTTNPALSRRADCCGAPLRWGLLLCRWRRSWRWERDADFVFCVCCVVVFRLLPVLRVIFAGISVSCLFCVSGWLILIS